MTDARPRPAFAHASEAELARILDFYEVGWEYEPHTFPILFDREGAVLESFSPDFYLPDLDLYVELTTLKQRLVRKKNRKLRRLRELYPGLRIKLLYARDFRALLLKYGRIALADALSGAVGQATPDRDAAGVLTAAGDGTSTAGARPRPVALPMASTPDPGASSPPAAPGDPVAPGDPAAPGDPVAAPRAARRSSPTHPRRPRRTRSEARARAAARAAAVPATEEPT